MFLMIDVGEIVAFRLWMFELLGSLAFCKVAPLHEAVNTMFTRVDHAAGRAASSRLSAPGSGPG